MRVGADEIELEVTSEEGVGGMVAAAVRMVPGGGPPALHRHAASELYRVERGRLAFYVEGDNGEIERFAAGPGRTVAIPGGREHTIRNESAADAVAFVVYAPGAEMEAFGVEITRPLAEVA